MIPRVHIQSVEAAEALAGALGRAVSDQEGLTEYTVVAHWPDLDFFTPAEERKTWTSADWAEHLDDPNWQYAFAITLQNDSLPIWHADMRQHPGDRTLTGPEWSEIAHRLARTAGIHTPGDGHGCRWIAVQAQTGRLDLIANLIRPDDTWTRQPHRLVELLSDECRRIERDLDLIAPRPDLEQAARPTAVHNEHIGSVEATEQLSRLLRRLADETTGPLATVRGLVEHAAHRLDGLPHAYGPATGHQLAWFARRLHGLQQDLDTTAAALTAATRTPPPAAPTPAPPASARGRLPR